MVITKGFAQISNVDMYYEMAGEGEALLLIHGVDSDSRMWDSQFEEFSKHYKTIRFDLRGFGRTPMPPGEFQLLDDIHDLLAALDIESAHVLGYSYGGTVAPSFALKYPNMVKSLILISAGMVGHQWSNEVQSYFEQLQIEIKQNNLDQVMRLLKWKSIYGPHREQKGLDDICTLLDQMFLHVLSLPREGKPLSTGDTRHLLRNITVPTLVLVGELDFDDYHFIADFYNNHISNSRLSKFPNAAHFMNLENPQLFNSVVLDYLQNL